MNYSTVRLELGLPAPLRFLFIADSHLICFDGRDNEKKRAISERRHREYEVTNVGRNLPYLLQALDYAKHHCDLLLHGGDLIDMVSSQNLEVAQWLLKDVDYLLACGNHEYTHYSGPEETEEEKAEARRVVPPYFRNDLTFASREIGGLNLIALYNGDYQFTRGQLEKLQAEVAKGLPILMIVHNPFYTPGLHRYRIEEEKETRCSLLGCPEELLAPLPNGDGLRADAETREFIDYLKQQPLIKGVLAGHVHLHQAYNDILFGDTRQYVTGGGYYGCGIIFEVS